MCAVELAWQPAAPHGAEWTEEAQHITPGALERHVADHKFGGGRLAGRNESRPAVSCGWLHCRSPQAELDGQHVAVQLGALPSQMVKMLFLNSVRMRVVLRTSAPHLTLPEGAASKCG